MPFLFNWKNMVNFGEDGFFVVVFVVVALVGLMVEKRNWWVLYAKFS